ncbi:MAG: HK97 family phage prohead protease [Dehalococcoidia bacterium]
MARTSDIRARAARQTRELGVYKALFENGRAVPAITRDVDGGLAADVAVVRKACGLVTKAEADEDGILRTVSIVASTPLADSYGDIIVQTGWDLGRFKANPVLLIDHGEATGGLFGGRMATIQSVVGKGVKGTIQKTKAELTMDGRLDDESNETANLIRSRLANGSVKTVSVGFVPLAWEEILDENGEWTGGYKFLKSELLEVSFVAIPANTEAVVTPQKTTAPEKPGPSAEEQAIMVNDLATRLYLNRMAKRLNQ